MVEEEYNPGILYVIICAQSSCTIAHNIKLIYLLSRENSSSPVDSIDSMDTVEEQRVHSPPASLVPRIHVILAQKLQHINPLLPACLNEEESKSCKCIRGMLFHYY